MKINIQVHGEDGDGGWEILQYIEKHVRAPHCKFFARLCLETFSPDTRDLLDKSFVGQVRFHKTLGVF